MAIPRAKKKYKRLPDAVLADDFNDPDSFAIGWSRRQMGGTRSAPIYAKRRNAASLNALWLAGWDAAEEFARKKHLAKRIKPR